MIAYGWRLANLEGAIKSCADKALRREPGCSLCLVIDHKGSQYIMVILSLQAVATLITLVQLLVSYI